VRFSGRARLVALASAALAVLAAPALLLAHARLVRSSPAVDSRVDAPPTSLRPLVSERPELRFTTVHLLDSTGARFPSAPSRPSAGNVMGVTMPIQSIGGEWSIHGRLETAAADGHPTTGKFAFVCYGKFAGTRSRTHHRGHHSSADETHPSQTPQVGHALVEPAATTPFSTAARWAELMAVLTMIGRWS